MSTDSSDTSFEKFSAELVVDQDLAAFFYSVRERDITSKVVVERLRAVGGFADVYEGVFREYGDEPGSTIDGSGQQAPTGGESKVAIKRFRIFANPGSMTTGIVRELKVWKDLRPHRNVIPLRGFIIHQGVPSLVSNWMRNGNLKRYLEKYPGTNRLILSKGIAGGLAHLHAHGIVHSDLKSDNVLIDDEGNPLLCDFGISRVVDESMTVTGTKSLKGNVRWMAIELIAPMDVDSGGHQFHTKESDVWAFGMVLYEVITGKFPFSNLQNEVSVMMAIMNGRVPERSPSDEPHPGSDKLWNICTLCWEKSPKARPTMGEILDDLWIGLEIKLEKEFEINTKHVNCATFSPANSGILASSSPDNTLRVWSLNLNADSANLLCPPLVGHTDAVHSIAWSSDGSFLVSGANDKTLRKWDPSSGTCAFVTAALHTHWVYTVTCSPHNKNFASGGLDGSVFIWDASSGDRILGPLTGHEQGVTALSYSRDSKKLVSGSNGSIAVWDSESGTKVYGFTTHHTSWIVSISFHPSGSTFVTGSDDETINIWDANTFEPLRKNLHRHTGTVSSLGHSTDGRHILSSSWDGRLTIWDVPTGKPISKLTTRGQGVLSAAFSRRVNEVLGCDASGVIKVWEVRKLCED